jgi:hypothetical protein
MTEEETFRILARIPFHKMQLVCEVWHSNPDDNRGYEQLLKDNNWTIDEYDEYFHAERVYERND